MQHPNLSFFLSGLGSLPERVFAGVSGFFTEYLGTTQQEVPFGGRGQSLLQLEAWLASESPYALLVAEAGRGKSALLVRWTAELSESHQAQVVFLPISIRFGTALKSAAFHILGTKLKTKKESNPSSLDAYRAEIYEKLSTDRTEDEPPLLVVLDGLDEAADWYPEKEDLFPPKVGRGVKLLFSARSLAERDQEGWRRALGLPQEETLSISLPLLDRPGVSDVLLQMQAPLSLLGGKGDITQELYRLSEGDPLLLRLYVEALRTQGEEVALLGAGELSLLSPGLSGYFDRWWAEQRKLWAPGEEVTAQSLVRLFSCALGPLSFEDLCALFAFHGISTETLEKALFTLRRFVIGDKEKGGYVFSHPRLGYYFLSQLTQAEQQAWEKSFLAFGREVLRKLQTKELYPKQTPVYSVRYLGAHLERSGATVKDLETLVAPYWQEAWEHLEGTPEGFITDIQRTLYKAEEAWEQAKTPEEKSAAIVQQYRCALVSASVHSLASNVPMKLVIALLEANLWSPAIAYAYVNSMEHGDLEALVPYLPESLVRKALHTLADEIQQSSWDGDCSVTRITEFRSFPMFAKKFVEMGYEEELLRILDKQAPQIQAEVLLAVTPVLSIARKNEMIQKAYKCIQTLPRRELKGMLLLEVSPLLPNEQQKEAQEEALASFQEHTKKYRPYPYWCKALAKAGMTEKALEYARSFTELYAKLIAFTWSAPYIPASIQSSVIEEALGILQESLLERDNWFSRKNCFEFLQNLHLLSPDKGEVFCREHLNQLEGTFVLLSLATKELPALSPRARDALNTLEEHNRIVGRLRFGAIFSREELEAAARVFLEKKDLSEEWKGALSFWVGPFGNPWIYLYLDAVRCLPEAERDQKLLELLSDTRHIIDHEEQSGAFSSIATLLPKEQQTNAIEATQQALARAAPMPRAMAIAHALPILPEQERESAACESATTLASIQERNTAVQLLALVLPHLPKEKRPEIIASLVARVEQDAILFTNHKLPSLISVMAPYLSEEQTDKIFGLLPHISEDRNLNLLLELLLELSPVQRYQRLEAFLVGSANVKQWYHQLTLRFARLVQDAPKEILLSALSTLPQTAPAILRDILQKEVLVQEGESILPQVYALPEATEKIITLSRLLPRLSSEKRQPVWESLYQILTSQDASKIPISVFEWVAWHLAPLGYSSALIALASQNKEYPIAPLEALLFLAHFTPKGERKEILSAALDCVTTARYRSTHDIERLQNFAEDLSPEKLFPIWKTVLREMSLKPREGLLQERHGMGHSFVFPYLKLLGGEEALQITIGVIREVALWFS